MQDFGVQYTLCVSKERIGLTASEEKSFENVYDD